MDALEKAVRRAAAGEVDAFAELVARFRDMAFAYAYSLLGDFHMAEDAAQEAFIDAYAGLPRLRAPGAFPAWFKRIVHRRALSLRKKAATSTVPIDGAEAVPPAARTPAESAEAVELRTSVLSILDSLCEHERRVVLLYYIDGYSQREVAGFLGVPLGTVKSRLYNARKRLARRMLAMAKDVLSGATPGDAFDSRVKRAIEVYTAKGPGCDSTGSEWDNRVRQKIGELLESGREGFEVAATLSRSEHAKARVKAALHFGLCGDREAGEHLVRLMKDRAASVRRMAVRAYAEFLYGSAGTKGVLGIGSDYAATAHEAPAGIEALFDMTSDPDEKTSCYAAHALGQSAGLGNAAVDKAMRSALADTRHKVRHAAAGWLKTACPKCGTRPDLRGRGEGRKGP